MPCCFVEGQSGGVCCIFFIDSVQSRIYLMNHNHLQWDNYDRPIKLTPHFHLSSSCFPISYGKECGNVPPKLCHKGLF